MAESDPSAVGSQASEGTPLRSRELAERSIKERRRARDRRAERVAFGSLVAAFAIVGTLGYLVLQSSWFEALMADPNAPLVAAGDTPPKPKEPERRRTSATVLDETPDLPALRMMSTDGLTIAAEGLPEVGSEDTSGAASMLAAVETCRFAYGVWEFSPNKRFRFLSTCGAFDGQILVGAYEVVGSRVKMSALVDGPAAIVSEFEVEKPSRMMTEITIAAERPIRFSVNQRITTLRAGLEGESFRATYGSRNTLEPPGTRAQEEPVLLQRMKK